MIFKEYRPNTRYQITKAFKKTSLTGSTIVATDDIYEEIKKGINQQQLILFKRSIQVEA